MTAATMSEDAGEFLQQECITTAKALEARFTSRRRKRVAATILHNMVLEKPHCGFCGTGPDRHTILHPSKVKPMTWICDGCAIYIGRHAVSTERKEEQWVRLKDFAP